MKFFGFIFGTVAVLALIVKITQWMPTPHYDAASAVEAPDERALRVARELALARTGRGFREVERKRMADGTLLILGDVNVSGTSGRPQRWVFRFNAARELDVVLADGKEVLER